MNPTVSVLMPVYNCADFIESSVESILLQTFSDFEFLIIDDFSTDGTYEYLQSLTDSRIKLIRKSKNTGYAISLNIGLNNARGKYIARMDADDISLPERFARQVSFMDNQPEVVVCGSWYENIGNGKGLVKYPLKNEELKISLLEFNAIGHPTVIMRKSVLDQFDLRYDENMDPAEDYDFWIRIARYGKLANIGERLLLYRIHYKQESFVKKELQDLKSEQCQLKGLQQVNSIIERKNFSYNPNESDTLNDIINQLLRVQSEWEELSNKNKLVKYYDIVLFKNYTRLKAANIIRSYFLSRENKNYKTATIFLWRGTSFFKYFNKKEIIKIALSGLCNSFKSFLVKEKH